MTLSALGIFSAAGQTLFTGDFDLIETAIVSGTSTSTITFSGLGAYASSYKHLQIRGLARTSRVAVNDFLYMRVNGDTGANYSSHNMFYASPPASDAQTSTDSWARAGLPTAASATASSFGPTIIDIVDAYSTSKNKTLRSLASHNTTNAMSSGLWRNTAAITDLTFFIPGGPTFVAGSRLSLYGIKG